MSKFAVEHVKRVHSVVHDRIGADRMGSGNLRRLLRTMIALRETDRFTVHDLPPAYRQHAAGMGTPPSAVAEPAAELATLSAAARAPAPDSRLNPCECAKRQVLLQELKRQQWSLSGVARELIINRNTLYRKLQRLNIAHPDKSLFH